MSLSSSLLHPSFAQPCLRGQASYSFSSNFGAELSDFSPMYGLLIADCGKRGPDTCVWEATLLHDAMSCTLVPSLPAADALKSLVFPAPCAGLWMKNKDLEWCGGAEEKTILRPISHPYLSLPSWSPAFLCSS